MFKIVLECNSVNSDESRVVSDLSYQFSAIMGSPGTSENRQVPSVTWFLQGNLKNLPVLTGS